MLLFSNIKDIEPSDGPLDEKVYRKLFNKHYDHLRNFLYYKTSDRELSEDVAQDAFIKLWETRDKVRMSTVKTYLFTIANNLAINKLKRNQLKYNFLARTEMRNETQDPQYLMEEQEFKAELEGIIASMPEGSREVFLMNRLDDLKYGEIADLLGISVKAVEKRMSKALAILRETIGRKI